MERKSTYWNKGLPKEVGEYIVRVRLSFSDSSQSYNELCYFDGSGFSYWSGFYDMEMDIKENEVLAWHRIEEFIE